MTIKIVDAAKPTGITFAPEKDKPMLLSLWKRAGYKESGQSVRFHGNGHIQRIVTKKQKRKSHLGRCEREIRG